VKRTLTLALVLVVVSGLFVPATFAAEPSGVYLSLGDSLAAGFQQGDGVVTDDSYTDVLFQRTADQLGLTTHIKLGCPGETSSTFITGGCPHEAEMGGYDYGSQMGDALAAIAAAGPDLKLITIDIGAIDVLSCLDDLHGQPTLEACLGVVVLPNLAYNLTVILATLQAAAPGVPIVGANYYNPELAWAVDDANAPFPGFGLASQDLIAAVNGVLAATYAGYFGGGAVSPVPVADVATAFRTFDEKRQIDDVCRFTQMCERDGSYYVMSDWNPAPGIQPDIHPTDIGYRQMAWAFAQAMEAAGIL